MQPLARVHAVERLVEEQDLRVVDERAGELRALSHALRVRRDRTAGAPRSARPWRWPGPRPRPGRRALQARVEQRELEPGQERVDGLALGHQPDAGVHLRVGPRRLALDDAPRRRTAAAARPSGAAASTCRRRSGPSSPVTPGPSANEMSLTATTLPYQRETWSTASAGTATGRGDGGGRGAACRSSVMPRSAGSGGWSARCVDRSDGRWPPRG